MKMLKLDTFCSYCGIQFINKTIWPRSCNFCGSIAYSNPLPVVVAVITVKNIDDTYGVLSIRRAINPDVGKLCLVSGYIDNGEHWRHAMIREIKEEANLDFNREDLELIDVDSSKDMKHILIFCKTPTISIDEVPTIEPNEEVEEIVVVNDLTQLVWESHQEISRKVLA